LCFAELIEEKYRSWVYHLFLIYFILASAICVISWRSYVYVNIPKLNKVFLNFDPLWRRTDWKWWYYKVSILYCACYIYRNLPLESLYLLKKLHKNPLGSFKDLCIHKNRQLEATLFYTMLGWFLLHPILNLSIGSETYKGWNKNPLIMKTKTPYFIARIRTLSSGQ
jgi:hypothetical protein